LCAWCQGVCIGAVASGPILFAVSGTNWGANEEGREWCHLVCDVSRSSGTGLLHGNARTARARVCHGVGRAITTKRSRGEKAGRCTCPCKKPAAAAAAAAAIPAKAPNIAASACRRRCCRASSVGFCRAAAVCSAPPQADGTGHTRHGISEERQAFDSEEPPADGSPTPRVGEVTNVCEGGEESRPSGGSKCGAHARLLPCHVHSSSLVVGVSPCPLIVFIFAMREIVPPSLPSS